MASTFYIPNGPKNIASIFPGIDFNNVQEYFIEVFDEDGLLVCTTPLNKVCKCSGDESVRVHFLNYLGTYDALNFLKPEIVHEDTSGEFQKGLQHPLQKTDTGIERFNVNSNDTYEVKLKCSEKDMVWLQECADSPKMFMEWNGAEGQPAAYIPVIKLAGSFKKLKNDREFDYDFIIKFKLSNEFITIRN